MSSRRPAEAHLVVSTFLSFTAAGQVQNTWCRSTLPIRIHVVWGQPSPTETGL
ncbi:hypothetical protein PR003_g18311 [Phytophthora rubi]|uniref:Uncharacterized protein n=1 Tax=Phytophthora rubi TaxID=129364 RepID=A0A6A3K4H9_9STRA|nr:hypothetical protein PR002_g18183 [Phytophthora rubi]KAE9018491.1 hypothetical protein PR001_g14125 [Phytophthora rubi]KAE9318156.1 hypothetical protein PR003_g18311 [Phytophthora rubi]